MPGGLATGLATTATHLGLLLSRWRFTMVKLFETNQHILAVLCSGANQKINQIPPVSNFYLVNT